MNTYSLIQKQGKWEHSFLYEVLNTILFYNMSNFFVTIF